MRRIYLDHSATTPLSPEVLEAMEPWLRGDPGNPSSPHHEGRRARRAVEDAREEVAALLGAEARNVIFTSGATEANVTALLGLRLEDGTAPPAVAASAVEHPSVLETLPRLERGGRRVRRLPVDACGRVKLETLREALAEGVRLVAVMAANNETGTVQPWEEVARLCREQGALAHTDAVQVLGKLPFEVGRLGPGSAALSAHKLGGPQGVGALWVAPETRLEPLLTGGGQERARRAGTESVAGIVGLGAACRLAREEQESRRQHLELLEARFLEELRAQLSEVVVNGPPLPHRVPGLLNLRFPGCHGETLLFALDLEGVAASLGSACSSGAVEPSHVLEAMGASRSENLESLRFSLGWTHSLEELAEAAARIARVVHAGLDA